MCELSRNKNDFYNASSYADLACELANSLTDTDKAKFDIMAKHYKAKVLIYQAQNKWLNASDLSNADSEFQKGFELLQECATSAQGYYLSCNLLGLWYSVPSPILTQQSVFKNTIVEINYIQAFKYFLTAVHNSRAQERVWAARQCISLLLEQRIQIDFNTAGKSNMYIPKIEELTLIDILSGVLECPNVWTIRIPDLTFFDCTSTAFNLSLHLVNLLFAEIEHYNRISVNYYKGLFYLYKYMQEGNTDDYTKSKKFFEYEYSDNNSFKKKECSLCLAFLNEQNIEELQNIDIPTSKDNGRIDRFHSSYNKVNYDQLYNVLYLLNGSSGGEIHG